MVASDVLPSGGSLAAQLSPSGCATTVWLPPAFWLPSGSLARRWPALWQCFLAARSAGAGGTLALSFGCFLAAFWWLARPGPARPSTLAALRVAFWLLRPAQPASAGLSPTLWQPSGGTAPGGCHLAARLSGSLLWSVAFSGGPLAACLSGGPLGGPSGPAAANQMAAGPGSPILLDAFGAALRWHHEG